MIDHPTNDNKSKNNSTFVPEIHAKANTNQETNDHEMEATQSEKKQVEAPVTEANKPVIAEIAHQPVMESMTPFDTIFGVNQDQQQQQQQDQEEDEPVMVSSLSDSEVSDPFTASTNSSTHRVAPPPPQSRRSASTTGTSTPTAATTSARQSKKPPAPPPPHRNQTNEPQDFDAIFGTLTPKVACSSSAHEFESDDNDEFDTYFSDPKFTNNNNKNKNGETPNQGTEFDSVFAVTPTPGIHAVSSGTDNSISNFAVNPAVSTENNNNDNNNINKEEISTTSPFDQSEFNNAFNTNVEDKVIKEEEEEKQNQHVPPAIQHGFEDSFDKSSPTFSNVQTSAANITETAATATAGSSQPELEITNAIPANDLLKGENQGVESFTDNNISRGAKEEKNRQESYNAKKEEKTKKENPIIATNSSSSKSVPNANDDGKKKKKKKNIVSWAKSFGGFDFSGLDNEEKKKKKSEKKSSKKEQQQAKNQSSGSNSNTPSVPGTQNSSGFDDNIQQHSPSLHEPQQASSTTATLPPATNTTTTPANTNINTNTNTNNNDNNNFAYDLDTIQGSHIAELVNMGFDPASALEALDRYDQNLEKATNFLLDQAYN
jgi:hypothetical protein